MELVNYEWRYHAACKDNWRYEPKEGTVIPVDEDDDGAPPEVLDAFFPPRNKDLYTEVANYAKTFCNTCPVKNRCLWDAISRDEPHGIWGGYSHRERNAIIRKWQRTYAKQIGLKDYVLNLGGKYGKN